MTEQKEIRLGSYETNSWYYIPKQEKTFLKDTSIASGLFSILCSSFAKISRKLSLQEWRLLEIQTCMVVSRPLKIKKVPLPVDVSSSDYCWITKSQSGHASESRLAWNGIIWRLGSPSCYISCIRQSSLFFMVISRKEFSRKFTRIQQ